MNRGFILLTETNVPNRENLSYFGDGDEAHMVYQFSLPPLLLYTLYSGNAGCLMKWLASLPETGSNCTFFNFTASHDGIGVRPLEGLLEASAMEGESA
jgi:sucrose phosphorylase